MPDTILVALFGLAGVLVGGFITYLTTKSVETERWEHQWQLEEKRWDYQWELEGERWEQQRKDRLMQDRREALSAVMDWLGPIDNAVNRATMRANPLRQTTPGQDAREWEEGWPNLLNEISKRDLRQSARWLLPPGIYEGANPIIRQIDDVRSLYVQLSERQFILVNDVEESDDHKAKLRANIDEMSKCIWDEITSLRLMTEQDREKLIAEYRATYGVESKTPA
jgi:hypothetical protein